MYTKRRTAFKVWIKDLLENVQTEEGQADEPIQDIPIFRINVLATVVQTYESEDKNYSFIVVDDGTETIRVKAFREDTKKLKDLKKADMVRVIAKVREYNGEVYLHPEIVKKVGDPNWWTHHIISIARQKKLQKTLKEKKEKIPEEQEIEEEVIETPRTIVFRAIKKFEGDEGVTVQQLVEKTPFNEEVITEVANDLLRDGELFEPKPGKLKII